MRAIQLSSLKQGIQRIRDKGGASPDALHDLLNGYVTIDGGIKSRPGTELHAELPAGTVGIMPWNERLLVFANEVKTGLPAGVDCEVIVHPTAPSTALSRIWFARPMMGFPYVVAEFADGSVYHYWLKGSGEESTAWQANNVYQLNDVVVPGNGLAYKATRLTSPAPAWEAGVPRTVGDTCEPTEFNGYQYEVVEVGGTNPRSGTTEPTWPESDGAVVYELVDTGGTSAPTTPSTDTSDRSVPSDTEDRYCVVADSWLDDGTKARDAKEGDLHWTWTPEDDLQYTGIVAVGAPQSQPCVRITLDDGSILRCSASTPFTDPLAKVDGEGWLATDMLGKRAFNHAMEVREVVAVDAIGMQTVIPIDFGGRSFAAGDKGLVYSHNIDKKNYRDPA